MHSKTLEFWVDLNLPPILALWLQEGFNVIAKSFYDLSLVNTSDVDVFKLARKKANTIIITTKDYDFIWLAKEIGTPPKILYLNIGNISNSELKKIVLTSFKDAIKIFEQTNQTIVEITK